MENEKKGKKILEIILIVLVALSFVLIPLLNQYRQKTISLNRSQLVNRQNVRNGNIDITDYQNGDVYTISAYFESYNDYNFEIDPITIDENKSLTDVNDVFGWGIPNYFRFYTSGYSLPSANNVQCLQFYVELDSTKFLTYNLSYYEVYDDNDEGGNFMRYRLISKTEFSNAGILARYDVLNISYYGSTSISNFEGRVFSNTVLDTLFNITTNYQLRSNYFSFIHGSNVHFIDINYDIITGLVASATKSGFDEGFKNGYDKGVETNTGTTSVFGVLQKASSAISAFLNIEILPNLSMWLLLSIPFSITIMVVLLRLLRGGS